MLEMTGYYARNDGLYEAYSCASLHKPAIRYIISQMLAIK